MHSRYPTHDTIAYLHNAQRRCACGHVRAVARACARRLPAYNRPTLRCDDCGARVEQPDPVAATSPRQSAATVAASPLAMASTSGAEPNAWQGNTGDFLFPEQGLVCSSCGHLDGENDVAVVRVEIDSPERPHRGVWTSWCLDCIAAADAANFPLPYMDPW